MDKYKTITEHYGINTELKKLSEEVFELQEAILEKHNTEHITEELADVYVVLEQVRRAYEINTEELAKVMNDKVDRQIQRIGKENK